MPCREADVVVQPGAGVEHRVGVREWFTHAHEHHIRDPLRRRVLRPQNLLHDLAGREVTLEAGLPRCAERATHRAARLGGDADRRALRVPHEHGLDLRSVVGAPQPFRRGVVVGELHRVDGERERQLLGEPGDEILGHVRQRLERAPLFVQALIKLARPVGGLAERGKQRFDLGPA